MDLKQFNHRKNKKIILLVLLVIVGFVMIKSYSMFFEKVNEIHHYQIQKEMQEKSLKKLNLKEV